MIYFCCDTLRRDAVRGGPLNGIDFIEVLDLEAPVSTDRQRFLHVHLLNDPGAQIYTVDNIQITGGGVAVTIVNVVMGLGPQTNVVVVEVEEPGDFSGYCLGFVRGLTDLNPPAEFDPMLANIDFSFKVECPNPFDCLAPCDCPPDEPETPNISYLARDFSTFSELMFNRMAQVAPELKERNPADVGVAIVETLAYVADQFAFQQDALSAEGYLNRLRSRISARRLGRMVDYQIDEGANARCFCHIAVSAVIAPVAPDFLPVIPTGSAVSTLINQAPIAFAHDDALLDQAETVFETVHPLESLYADHNEMHFYTWSDRRCSLPKGAMTATLAGHFPDLVAGMYLVIEEIIGPRTGNTADRDLDHRQVVRLTEVVAINPELGGPLVDPVTGTQITNITWEEQDALQFPVCISAETAIAFGRRYIEPVSVARGNIVLVDHGRTFSGEDLGTVPEPELAWAPGRGLVGSDEAKSCAEDVCEHDAPQAISARFRPVLQKRPLSFAAPFEAIAAAHSILQSTHGTESAQIVLQGDDGVTQTDYNPVRDLLASGDFAPAFTTEIERDGSVQLRFGDGIHGRRPVAGTFFLADYRVGNGKSGNIGADKLRHLAVDLPEVISVRNVIPARGGRDAETIAELRRRAPFAYRRQERTVTRADYKEVGKRLDWVQDIAASFVHTGSWLTAFAVADPVDRLGLTFELEDELRAHYEPFRMAGRDLEIESPDYVPLEITLRICVAARSLRSPVRTSLQRVFSSTRNPDGSLGFFHPDNFQFGETLHLSSIIAAAQAVTGVSSVTATRFRRLGDSRTSGLVLRKLTFARREIPRVDNDPSNQGNGVLQLDLVGGR